jgi:uncharacterized protein (DUF885 family)
MRAPVQFYKEATTMRSFRWAWAALLLVSAAPERGADLQQELVDLFLDARLHEVRSTTLDEYLFAREFREAARGLRPEGVEAQVDLELLKLLIERKIAHFELEERWTEGPTIETLPSTRWFDLLALLPAEEAEKRLEEAEGRLRAPESLGQAQLETLRAHLARVESKAGERFLKALERYRAALERTTPDGRAPPGRGPADLLRSYRFVLRHQLFVDHTPESLLEYATRAYAETRGRLEALARRIDPAADWRALVEKTKEARFALDTLHAESRALALRARDFAVEKELATIPEGAREFDVRPAPADAITPFGHYRARTQRSRGVYVTAPVSPRMPAEELEQRLRDNNKYWTAIVALHEAVPGHHLQHEVARETRRPRLRRAFAPPTYVEGWGLYTEQMMFRNGYFGADPLYELTLLRMRLWRCARVAIDLGLQTGSMTQEEAERLLVDGVRLEPVSARAEVEQYRRRPGYFSGYLLGCDLFLRMRERCEERLGARFSEREFHDQVLRLGPLPLAQLERLLLP